MSVTKGSGKESLNIFIDFLNLDLNSKKLPKAWEESLEELERLQAEVQKLEAQLAEKEAEVEVPSSSRVKAAALGESTEKLDVQLSKSRSMLDEIKHTLTHLQEKVDSQVQEKKNLKKYLDWNFQGNEEVVRSVQAEIRGDLSPIAARKVLPESIYPYRERWEDLCFKLTEMNFTRHFGVPVSLRQKKDGRIVVLGSNIIHGEQQKGRGSMYALLADLLEKGEIERLRLCPVCRKFFAATRSTSRFCSPSCGDIWDRKDAVNRQKRYRVKKPLKDATKKAEKENQRAMQCFENFINMAATNFQGNNRIELGLISSFGNGDTSRGWRKIKELYEQLKSGVLVQEIWGNTPQSIKDQFRS